MEEKQHKTMHALLKQAEFKGVLWPRTHAERLEAARAFKEINYSDERIADILGVSPNTVQKWLADMRCLGKKDLKKEVLARLQVGCSINAVAREYGGQVHECTIMRWRKEEQQDKDKRDASAAKARGRKGK